MKFAIVEGVRREATPKLPGACISCGAPMVPKCGRVRVWHWAHKDETACDHWWESETEWHRSWKSHFPTEWQEVVHRSECGEKHIADVKTDQGWVIEFQHSFLKPEERQSRDDFYKDLCWVVDGKRRLRDSVLFQLALETGTQVGQNALVRIVSTRKAPLLREWGSSTKPVFFDFGPGPTIWWMVKPRTEGVVVVAPFARAEFIEIHLGGATAKLKEFREFVEEAETLYTNYITALQSRGWRLPLSR